MPHAHIWEKNSACYIPTRSQTCWFRFWEFIATSCSNKWKQSTKMCTVRSLHHSRNSALLTQVLKIHQNTVSYSPTRTWNHWLKSRAKNHATSSFTQKLGKNATFGSSPCCFFPFTHCQKLYLVLRSKNAANFSSLFAIRKNPHFQAPACTCLFCALLKICLL